MSKTQINEKET